MSGPVRVRAGWDQRGRHREIVGGTGLEAASSTSCYLICPMGRGSGVVFGCVVGAATACGSSGGSPGVVIGQMPDAAAIDMNADACGTSNPPAVDVAASGTCSFSSPWTTSASIQHFEFDPIVVNPRIADTVAFKLKAPASVDAAELELAAGGTVTLTPSGTNLFCATLTPSQVLFDYRADDAGTTSWAS